MKQKKVRIATIPLSLRGKKRYILFRVFSPSPIEKSLVEKSFYSHLVHSFGILGFPTFRYRFISYNAQNGIGIFRCSHIGKDALIASLLFLTIIHNDSVEVHALQTSGTLHTLKPRLNQSP
ncbi:MAG: Rpp14/Pop5 family protein [Candidatus Diapherotrites archaeon]